MHSPPDTGRTHIVVLIMDLTSTIPKDVVPAAAPLPLPRIRRMTKVGPPTRKCQQVVRLALPHHRKLSTSIRSAPFCSYWEYRSHLPSGDTEEPYALRPLSLAIVVVCPVPKLRNLTEELPPGDGSGM